MIKYICNNCNKIECETSICPICKQRTQISKSEIYWCENCNIPNYDKRCSCCNKEGKYIGTDIRPVFPKERLLKVKYKPSKKVSNMDSIKLCVYAKIINVINDKMTKIYRK